MRRITAKEGGAVQTHRHCEPVCVQRTGRTAIAAEVGATGRSPLHSLYRGLLRFARLGASALRAEASARGAMTTACTIARTLQNSMSITGAPFIPDVIPLGLMCCNN